MQRYKILILILSFISIQIGCFHPPTIKNWVEERGYIYYPDYSTINILGYEVQDGQLRKNSFLSLESEKGNIPDLTQQKNRMFKIEGSTEVEKFLTAITEGNITGKFEVSAEAEITLEKPFKESASAIIPVSSLDNLEMSIVTRVLNTGSMIVKIKDKKGIDITSSFKPKQITKIEGKVRIEFGNEIKISGEEFYVGYFPELKHFDKIEEKEIILKKGEQYRDIYIGIYAVMYDYREKDGLGEALVSISPSSFSRASWASEGPVRKQFSTLELEAEDQYLWKNAIDTSKGKTAFPSIRTDSQLYILKFGSHLGIEAIPMTEGIYLEVIKVDKQEVKLKALRIKYEDVKRQK